MNFQERPPMRGRGSFRSNFRSNFNRGGINRNFNKDDRPTPWKENNDRFENKNMGGFRGSGGPPMGGFNDKKEPPKDNRDFGQNRDVRPMGNVNVRAPNTQIKRNEPAKATPPPAVNPPANTTNQRTNDVEIIVTHKTLTEYAEFIERRLKTVGLSVDLLFPNEEVPLGRVLGNIASRGTLYALVVTQLSEEHKSVTVNILYGQTQEHRNMPLDDAVSMIMKNFEAYTKGERVAVVPPAGAVPVTAAGLPLGEKHPEFIQSLLNILVENRPLTFPQYDKVIGYLQEKKDQLGKNEVGGANNPPKPADPKAQLQNRILNMLSSSDSKVNLDKPSGMHPSSQTQAPSLLKDSTTFKALQSIVQSNLLGSRI